MEPLMIEKWEFLWGDKLIPVSPYDMVDTFAAAASVMRKEIVQNQHIRGDAQMKIIWEMHIERLELAKRIFSGVIEEDRKKTVHPQIPGKKTVKEGG
jgi:hypothetical protein